MPLKIDIVWGRSPSPPPISYWSIFDVLIKLVWCESLKCCEASHKKMKFNNIYSHQDGTTSTIFMKEDFLILFVLRPETKCHISNFSLHCKNTKSMRFCAALCAHVPGLEHNEEEHERKERSISIFKFKKKMIFFISRE